MPFPSSIHRATEFMPQIEKHRRESRRHGWRVRASSGNGPAVANVAVNRATEFSIGSEPAAPVAPVEPLVRNPRQTTSIVCPDRATHSTGAGPSDPSDEADRSLISLIRIRPATQVDRRRFLLGSDLEPTWQIGVHIVLTIGIQRRSTCCPSLESHSTTPCSYDKTLPLTMQPSREYWSREGVHLGSARKRGC